MTKVFRKIRFRRYGIIALLIVGNVLMFSLLRKEFKQSAGAEKGMKLNEMEYVDEGLQIISWSYSLLRYFKGNSPNT